jgi:hypothetical protein
MSTQQQRHVWEKQQAELKKQQQQEAHADRSLARHRQFVQRPKHAETNVSHAEQNNMTTRSIIAIRRPWH